MGNVIEESITTSGKTTIGSSGTSYVYGTNVTIYEGDNTVKFILTNNNSAKVNLYTSVYDTIISEATLTPIIGITELYATPTITYIPNGVQSATTLKFVGWYMVDKTTGETSLLAYDNTLTISAVNEDLDKYNIVKKYDNVGNNNLVPSESSIYANITDGTNSTIIMDEDGLTGLIMTISYRRLSISSS